MLYHNPVTLDEAFALYSPDTLYIAGGTDLGVALSDLMLEPEALIDLCGIEEMSGIKRKGGELVIGPCTKIADLAAAEGLPVCLTEGASAIGSPQIRNMATVGGNICNASPCGDTLTPLVALDAVFDLYSNGATRSLPSGEFFTGPKKTVLEKGEILIGIRIPERSINGTYSGFRMTGKRNGQVISQVNMAVCTAVEAGKITGIRIAAGSVAPVPLRLTKCEGLLENKSIDKLTDGEFLSELKKTAEDETAPISDVRAGEDYRRMVSGALLVDILKDLFPGGASK